jgi:hypothetical protein
VNISLIFTCSLSIAKWMIARLIEREHHMLLY